MSTVKKQMQFSMLPPTTQQIRRASSATLNGSPESYVEADQTLCPGLIPGRCEMTGYLKLGTVGSVASADVGAKLVLRDPAPTGPSTRKESAAECC